MELLEKELKNCILCPRKCGADRLRGKIGACHEKVQPVIARAALHMWEEPCITGEKGSGAVFFSGCAMNCVFCQNRMISGGRVGKEVSAKRLCEIYFELQEKGAENINLVTADHFLPAVIESVRMAKENGFRRPFIYNCSGYALVESLRCLEGLIDVYLPDFKYMSPKTAIRYSRAEDYPAIAKEAVHEMVRQTGEVCFDDAGRIKRGVIVRHLLLPGHVKEAMQIVDYLHETYGDKIYISLMNQYTPMPGLSLFPEINRSVSKREYERLVDYTISIGVENAYIQEGKTALESFIPEFDLRG